MNDALKRCRQCKRDKLPGAYHNDKSRPDGLCAICRNCTRERHLKRYVPKLVKAGGGHCSVCGSTRKIYRDQLMQGGRLCGGCMTALRLVKRDATRLDKLADYLDGKPSF